MGPTERAIPSLIELMREDGANPREGRPLALERIYQCNLISYEQYKAILDEQREERRRQRNSHALSEMEAEQLELDRRMRRACVPETMVSVSLDVTAAERLTEDKWLLYCLGDPEQSVRRGCMALKAWLQAVPFGTAAFARATTALSAFRENADGGATRLQTVGLLLLAGLGTEAATDWAVAQLYDLLDTRALNGLPTVITSVHRPEDLVAHLGGRGNEGAARAIIDVIKNRAILIDA